MKGEAMKYQFTDRELIAELLDLFEESHSDEVERDHDGDGPKGCSYCELIKKAKKHLKSS